MTDKVSTALGTHSSVNQITAGCVKCPKCGQKRFDPIAQACERRQCGYIAPASKTDGQKSNE